MIISLKHNATEEGKQELFVALDQLQAAWQYLPEIHAVVVPKYNKAGELKNYACVDRVTEIETPFQLASKAWKNKSAVNIGDIEISAETFTIIAGPCSVENEDQVYRTAEFLARCGVRCIRGGAFKPRTSPYSFRGMGVEGLKILFKAAQAHNLKVVTELLDLSLLDDIYQYADVLQVGSRNMQNFYMLAELGKTDKPVLLKRGMNAKVYEWLLAAEYILSGGNQKVILCERGIRSFDPQSRNVMDVGVIPLINELSHLPVIADPSHGTGQASRVLPMALASTVAGADGLIVEIHPDPARALSDKEQALTFSEFESLVKKVHAVLPLAGNKKITQIISPSLNLQS